MKKIPVVIFLLIFVVSIKSQQTNILWRESEVIDYGIEKKTFPKFENAGYTVESNNVFITVTKKSNGRKYKIINPIWVKISEKKLYDIEPLMLPDRDFFDVFYRFNRKENAQYFMAKLATFKYVKGEIFRLEGFSIAEENISASKKGNSKKNRLGSSENPLASGTFYKIKVDKSGVFKITKKFLADNGINPNNINPKYFRIYGNGGIMLPEYNQDLRFSSLQENAIQVVGEDDGRWDDDDYALFYAQGANGFNLYSDNMGNGHKRTETRQDRSVHLQNIYEDGAYYFINFDKGEGKRIQRKDAGIPSDLITRYDDYQFVDEEKYNLMKIGRVWVGDAFNKEKSITFNTRSPIRENDDVYYKISVVAYKSQGNTIDFNINGKNQEKTNIHVNAPDFIPIRRFYGTVKGLNGNAITLNMQPSLSGNPNGEFYFDYAEVVYKEDLKFNGGQMNFRDFSIREGSGNLYGFSMSGASEVEQIWDVSDITNISGAVNKSSGANFTFGYKADSKYFNNEFVAFKHSAAYTPAFVGRIANQDLHSLQNIDYLVITKNEMVSEAKRLTRYHENKNGFRTAIVELEQIYNEFSSGSQDITAIRDFISYLKNKRGGLRYVLLLGDTSYDFKNRISPNDNVIPSYQSENSADFVNSYVTDDYFVMTEQRDEGGHYITSILPDIPVGRLPASNASEAKYLIDKTLAYYNALPKQSSPFGEWRMKLDFVVDDNAEGGGPFHTMMDKVITDNFQTANTEYNVRKLYFDATTAQSTSGGQRFPQINRAIGSSMNNSLYMFYFGHGGINGWGQERVLTVDEIKTFHNFNSAYARFPLVSTITCEFTLWDTPDVSSAGEQMIKHKDGGAATMITSSRALSVIYGRNFTSIFTDYLFRLNKSEGFEALGDAHLAAKHEFGAYSDHLRVNFLGDPAMTLSRPKPLLKIQKIETPVEGQLRALDFVKISGFVSNENGSVNEQFNGKVVFNIFDKKNKKTTLNNDSNRVLEPKLSYQEEGNAVVNASGKVVNGKFEVEFYMPKEINYTLGDGRILGYADNFQTAKEDAYDVYGNHVIKIGDINPNGINDNDPPKIQLYMNNTNFVDGGITNQNPNLLACITDNTGINAAGSGIGHDITVILDGEVISTIQLNDFYSSGENNGCINPNLLDYQKGSVLYPFKNLKPGEHQLVFKVWDINNNSSTASLNFVVKNEESQKLEINRLLNWPNPFTDKTYIQFEHNCNDILDVNVQIYTITGKLVRTISQPLFAESYLEGFRTPRFAIEWDGKDDFGALVGKGTYIYKVLARSQNQEKCKGNAVATEKMVILK